MGGTYVGDGVAIGAVGVFAGVVAATTKLGIQTSAKTPDTTTLAAMGQLGLLFHMR